MNKIRTKVSDNHTAQMHNQLHAKYINEVVIDFVNNLVWHKSPNGLFILFSKYTLNYAFYYSLYPNSKTVGYGLEIVEKYRNLDAQIDAKYLAFRAKYKKYYEPYYHSTKFSNLTGNDKEYCEDWNNYKKFRDDIIASVFHCT